MTGLEFMSLSALEVKDYIEKTGRFSEGKNTLLTQVISSLRPRKIIKKSWVELIDDDLKRFIITNRRGKEIFVEYITGRTGTKIDWIATKIIIKRDGKIIDRYDRP